MNETRVTLLEAIARQRAIAVRYNGECLRLAPHLLFERHGDLFTSALNLSKSWRADEEPRLGQFKLAGLVAAELLEESFDALPSYQAAPPRQGDNLVMSI